MVNCENIKLNIITGLSFFLFFSVVIILSISICFFPVKFLINYNGFEMSNFALIILMYLCGWLSLICLSWSIVMNISKIYCKKCRK